MILPLVEKTIDKKNPKEWYYALMDYGAMLAKKVPNPNRNSFHYIKQTPFAGSNRQIRGAALKLLLSEGVLSKRALSDSLSYEDEKLSVVLNDLVKEGFLIRDSHTYKVQ
jgi:A/G-specific adenine glycosylase